VLEQVEISLSHDLRHHRHFGSDTYTPVELLAVKRFDHFDSAGYMDYADALGDSARYAAQGELGYTVTTHADGASVRVSLVGRLLAENGQLRTELSHEHRFEDPDSDVALVQASEKATELRALAQELNDNWNSVHSARVLEIQAEYEKADDQAEAAKNLDTIVDAEAE
jgi:hypothetical protein